jgi:hypothetical protein
MNDSLTNFRAQLIERLLEFLWRQWSALGVAGHARTDDPWLIDPEALLLFSSTVARHDARLFDEILDWLHRNGSWINLQRLGTLQKEEQLGDPGILAAIAEHLAQDSTHHKWKVLIRRADASTAPESQVLQPLFPGLPLLGEADPIFLKRAWQRGPLDLRGMNQAPHPDQPATFLFKLRALFGRQARAEIMAWLLTHDQGHPAEIARQTGYFRRTVQLVLNELAESGHVRAIRSGREKNFSIRASEWRFLLTWNHTESFPQWITWAPYFKLFTTFLETLSQPGIDERSEHFRAVQFREALDAVLPALNRVGLATDLTSSPELRGKFLIDSVLKDIDALLRRIVP